jgi:hypothetical protein
MDIRSFPAGETVMTPAPLSNLELLYENRSLKDLLLNSSIMLFAINIDLVSCLELFTCLIPLLTRNVKEAAKTQIRRDATSTSIRVNALDFWNLRLKSRFQLGTDVELIPHR